MSGANSNISDRRRRNNKLLGLVLFGFVSLVFAITVSKMMSGGFMEGFDHTVRPALEVVE